MDDRATYRKMNAGLDPWPEKRPNLIVTYVDQVTDMAYVVDPATGNRLLRLGPGHESTTLEEY